MCCYDNDHFNGDDDDEDNDNNNNLPKSVETSQGGKITILWNHNLTGPSPITSQTL
jgi:hypothetical protein